MILERFDSIVRQPLNAMNHRLSVCLLAGLLATGALAQPPVIFLVRHAERAAASGHVPSDTGLSSVGRARAESLARALKDAQITAIYTTEYKRTKETAAPLAQSLGIQPEVIQGDDLRSLLPKLKAARGNVLVVGHSNTLPQIINALGISPRVTVAESDFDNLFLVVLDRPPRLIHLHYR
jgi:broad specificity phosphatase PhoE